MSVGRVTAKTKIYEIEIELREVRPAVLRRVQVPGELSLAGLHAVVQVAMGWTDSHLHEFDVAGARYGLPDPDWDGGEVADEARVKLFRLLGQGDRVGYVYDFGDGWTHRLTVEKVLARSRGCRIRGACRDEGRARPRTWAARGGTTSFWRPWPILPIPSTSSTGSGWAAVRPGGVRPHRGQRGAGRAGLASAGRVYTAIGSVLGVGLGGTRLPLMRLLGSRR